MGVRSDVTEARLVGRGAWSSPLVWDGGNASPGGGQLDPRRRLQGPAAPGFVQVSSTPEQPRGPAWT